MIVLIDNYDSFTHNLEHLLRVDGEEVRTFRCDAITVEEVIALQPRRLVVSPGPGRPGDRGIAVPLVAAAARTRTPLLGVCLGHQAIAVAFGGTITEAPTLVHGKTDRIHHDGIGLFQSVPSPVEMMRYHSLVVDRTTLPASLEVNAWLDDRTIMGLRHRELPIAGIQFHPESFLSEAGPELVRTFMASTELSVS